jgi:hypothetical protein
MVERMTKGASRLFPVGGGSFDVREHEGPRDRRHQAVAGRGTSRIAMRRGRDIGVHAQRREQIRTPSAPEFIGGTAPNIR